jgi:anti-sigma factor RsiW
MTDCPRGDVRDLLPELVHDQLEPAKRAEVERHVAACPACAAEVALLRSMRGALSTAPRVDVGRIAAAVERARGASGPPIHLVPASAKRAGPVRPTRRVWADWRAAAGIAAVAVGIMSYSMARHTTIGPDMTGQPKVHRAESVAAVTAPVTANGANGKEHATSGTPAAASPRAGHASSVDDASRGVSFDGGVSDLPDSDLRALLQSVGELDGVPEVDPAPVAEPAPVIDAAIDDQSGGAL